MTLAHKLDSWEREARLEAVCTGCYGSGEDRWQEGRACAVCAGKGRAAREPHVLELVALVRSLLAEVGS
jgi:DnaJ-class molecular chaperone